MSRGPKNLGEMSKEVVDKNFLEETPDEIPINQKVVIAQEIPKYEKVKFFNLRDPGVALQFHYASKTHPLKQYTLYHGHEETLPVEVIKHLEGMNEADPYACHARLYGERRKVDGTIETYVNGYKPMFQLRTVR